MTKLDWQKKTRRRPPKALRDDGERQAALTRFVIKHALACFQCNALSGPWAKTGVSARGPWALCKTCIKTSRHL